MIEEIKGIYDLRFVIDEAARAKSSCACQPTNRVVSL